MYEYMKKNISSHMRCLYKTVSAYSSLCVFSKSFLTHACMINNRLKYSEMNIMYHIYCISKHIKHQKYILKQDVCMELNI